MAKALKVPGQNRTTQHPLRRNKTQVTDTTLWTISTATGTGPNSTNYVGFRSLLPHHSLTTYFTATHLLSQWKKWSTLYAKKKASFLAFSATISPDLLLQWKSYNTSTHSKSYLYEVQGNSTYRGFFTLSISHSLRSVLLQGLPLSSLSEQEEDSIVGVTELIRRGLELELSQ